MAKKIYSMNLRILTAKEGQGDEISIFVWASMMMPMIMLYRQLRTSCRDQEMQKTSSTKILKTNIYAEPQGPSTGIDR